MTPDFLARFDAELRYIKELALEFGRENPDLAGNLALGEDRIQDPYIERLLEGFAFLSARVNAKIDAVYPVFTQRLLDIIYPNFNAPIPSIGIFAFRPSQNEGDLSRGAPVPRGTLIQNELGRGQRVQVSYRTGHDVMLWPLEITELNYIPNAGSLSEQLDLRKAERTLRIRDGVRAAVRVRFSVTNGARLRDTTIDHLDLHVPAAGLLSAVLIKQLLGDVRGVVFADRTGSEGGISIAPQAVSALGLGDGQELLPRALPGFSGARLMQEWFACPTRFSFLRLKGLDVCVERSDSDFFDLFFLLGVRERSLDQALRPANIVLHATPAINLVPRTFARMQVDHRKTSQPIVVDRTRPRDFEVYHIESVTGYREGVAAGVPLEPVFRAMGTTHGSAALTYSLTRELRLTSGAGQLQRPMAEAYKSSEMYLSFSDPVRINQQQIVQLELRGLCTNADLPILVPPGTPFTADTSAPVEAVECLSGLTRPKPSAIVQSASAWDAVSQFALGHLSLLASGDAGDGAEVLRAHLRQYCSGADDSRHRQIEGIRTVRTAPVIRRLEGSGPISFARGVRFELVCDEQAFDGVGLYEFGMVLKEYLCRSAATNSFVDLVILTEAGGTEFARWEAIVGVSKMI